MEHQIINVKDFATEEEVAELNKRIAELEKENAVLKSKFETMQREMDNLASGIGRGLWILGGGFITAFVAWIVNGGLNAKG